MPLTHRNRCTAYFDPPRARPPVVAPEDLGGVTMDDDDDYRPPPWWAGLTPIVVLVGAVAGLAWAVWRATR